MTVWDALIEIYRSAYRAILEALATKEAGSSIANWERTLLADIAAILHQLDVRTAEWLEAQFPTVYLNGQTEAIRELVAMGALPGTTGGITPSLGGVHRSAIETLAQQLADDLGDARGVVGRRVQDMIREASLKAISRKVSQGKLVDEAKAMLRQLLADRGIEAITDAKGRSWRLDSYAEMVIRTTTREATNLGRMNQQQERGHDLVRMTVHHPTCPVCAVYQGRVYSIGGTDGRYPALYETVLSHGYHTVHPNCGHSFAPYVEALADDPERDRKASNAPFDVDPRTEKQRQAYLEGQRTKRKQREDRREWERMKAILPNDTPGFAGFRAMKRANSKRWQELQLLYRDARALVVSAGG